MTSEKSKTISEKGLGIIERALGVDRSGITCVSPMSIGMTNDSFSFECSGKKYIIREPGPGTEKLVSREHEAAAYAAIRGRGLCYDPAYIDPKSGYKITEFLDGVRNCDPADLYEVKRAMALLHRFHSMELQVEHSFSLLEHIEFYESLREGAPSVYGDYEQVKQSVLALGGFIKSLDIKHSLTHIDAVPDNFLFHEDDGGGEILQLIDWEYASMQDPHLDIAMFAIYSGYDREDIDRLIDIYFVPEGCGLKTRVKIYCYVAAGGLLWSNWCEYKLTLGVDFGDYALRQYDYAREFSALAHNLINQF